MADLVMPKLGLTMTEGLLTEWRVKPGQAFAGGEVLCIVETDKVANEVEATAPGTLGEVLVAEGETVPVGTSLARLAKGEGAAPAPQKEAPPAAAPATAATSPPIGAAGTRIVATPLARRLARQRSVDLAAVTGSGPRGRIKAGDVEKARTAAAMAPAAAAAAGVREEQPDAARLATAQRVAAAKPGVPHFYVTHEAEVSRLSRLRAELNAAPGRPRISVTHLLIKALGLTLAELPAMNRIWLDGRILAFDGADVGMVTETPQGLRIPVLRDAATQPLDDLARQATSLAQRARDGQLRGEEVGGGAVSLSNVGMFGVTGLAPIISPPQAMILGVGAERALFRPGADGTPEARRELQLTLAVDHRIVDGAEAARFLAAVARYLEAPLSLLRPPRSAGD